MRKIGRYSINMENIVYDIDLVMSGNRLSVLVECPRCGKIGSLNSTGKSLCVRHAHNNRCNIGKLHEVYPLLHKLVVCRSILEVSCASDTAMIREVFPYMMKREHINIMEEYE